MTGRYSSVAVALHWAIAVLILGQIAGGFYMHNLPNSDPSKFALFQLHKSFGFAVLALTVLRLGWRLTHKAPALPSAMPGWQKIAARATHWAFYALLFLTPLAGWALVSVSPLNIPTVWFGIVEIPHLPFFEGVADRAAAEDAFAARHEFLAKAMLFLLALHVGAALKHGFFDRDGVLRSIAPASARAWIGIVAIFAVLGAGVIFYSATGLSPRAAPAREAPVADENISPPTQAADEQVVSEEIASTPEATADPSAHAAQETETIAAAEPPSADNSRPNWVVDYGASSLRFVGTEKGRTFEGRFSEFSAEIYFDRRALELSWIDVKVSTASGATGDQIIDSSIGGGDWFDVKAHPTAQFAASDIRETGDGRYEADGELLIKEFSAPVTIAFTLAIDGDNARANGGADLMRTDFGLGADAYWLEEEDVGLEARVEFDIVATRAP